MFKNLKFLSVILSTIILSSCSSMPDIPYIYSADSYSENKIDVTKIKENIKNNNVIESKWSSPLKEKLITKNDNDKELYIEAFENENVYASNKGVVAYAGKSPKTNEGKMVIIKHDNKYLSAYSNLKDITVTKDEDVLAGDKIGNVGKFTDKNATLAFQIRKNGKLQNVNDFLIITIANKSD